MTYEEYRKKAYGDKKMVTKISIQDIMKLNKRLPSSPFIKKLETLNTSNTSNVGIKQKGMRKG